MHAYLCISTSSRGKDRFAKNKEVTIPVSHTIRQLSTKTKHRSCRAECTFPKPVAHTLKTTAVNILSPI